MQDVQDWLAVHDLNELKGIFARECIDGVALLELDETDFKTMGIIKLGHKKKLTRIISKLKHVMVPVMPLHSTNQLVDDTATDSFKNFSSSHESLQDLFEQTLDNPITNQLLCSYLQSMTNCPMLPFLQHVDHFCSLRSNRYRLAEAKNILHLYFDKNQATSSSSSRSLMLCSNVDSNQQLHRHAKQVQKSILQNDAHVALFDAMYSIVRDDLMHGEFALFLQSPEYVAVAAKIN